MAGTARRGINRIFPQNLNGINNVTPADCNAALIPLTDLLNLHLPPKRGWPFRVGWDFSSPTNVFNGVAKTGLTYAFDFMNARFVMLDMFDDSSNNKTSVIPQQQPWISAVLSDPARPEHAFVFTHKNLLGGQHKDNLFGTTVSSADPGDCTGVDYGSLSAANQALYTFKQQGEDAFISSLAASGVHYLFSGHDHHHYDSIVQSPLSPNRVHQLILASDSNKFYVPQQPVSTNDTPISQQLNTVGYYIGTVEGANVTIEYYAVDISGMPGFKSSSATENTITNTPILSGNWQKVLSLGYSVNGQEYVIPEGASYAGVADSTDMAVASGERGYVGTSAQILAGVNGSTAKTIPTNGSRPLSKAVDTGWAPAKTWRECKQWGCDMRGRGNDCTWGDDELASDVLTLWGMADLGTEQTDVYALAMSFDPRSAREGLGYGGLGIATRDDRGNWVNAVRMNFGGDVHFVKGPWRPSYPLGTYGVDANTRTAWAVLNYNGDFAVTTGIEPPPGHRN